MVNITSRPLYPRERIQVPAEYEAEWAPEPVWTFWRIEIYLASAGIRTPEFPARSLVITPLSTTLHKQQKLFSSEYSGNVTIFKERSRAGHELNGPSFILVSHK
jgi:hypothetical protein